MNHIADILSLLKQGERKALARAITIVENELDGCKEILFSLNETKNVPVIGFTGPPGAGKSTLINALIKHELLAGKKIAIVAVDPTSPFNFGSLLGDRLRMSEHFNDQNIFIRSVATRGSLGGLSEKASEIVDVIKASSFDLIFVETVGVGQSEVEIAGLADTTVVVFVPEAGDEVQTMKSGILEIADVFVVNKSDREGSDHFASHLEKLVHSHPANEWNVPVVKTSATLQTGIGELIQEITKHQQTNSAGKKKNRMLTEKAYRIIQKNRMKDINKTELSDRIIKASLDSEFNIYKFADSYSLTR